MKQGFGGAVRILVSFLAIGLVIFFLREKLGEAAAILRHEVRWDYFLASGVIYAVAILILSRRLQMIWRFQKIRMTFFEVLKISYAGLFFNFFLPSSVGGDIIKIYYAYRKGHDKVAATTSVMMDRLLGFLIVILMGVAAIMIQRQSVHDPFIYFAIGIFTAVIGAFSLLSFSRRIARRFHFLKRLLPSERILGTFRKIYHSFHGYRHELPLLAYGLVLSLMVQCLIVILSFTLSLSLDTGLPLGIFFMIVPITAIVSMAPSMGGLGVREAGSIYLFSQYMPSERALALTLLYDLIIYGFGLLGGVVFALMGNGKTPNLKEMEAARDAGSETA